MKVQLFRLVLVGSFAGKTVLLNGYTFQNGVLQLVDTWENIWGIVTYFGRSYGAYLEGSDELREAQETYAREKAKNGERDPQGTSQEPEHSASSEIQPVREGPAEVSAGDVSGDAPAEKRSESHVPRGNGHADPRFPEHSSQVEETAPGETNLTDFQQKVAGAVSKLDPDNDKHWTMTGLPKLAAVELVAGSTGVTREDVDLAVPEWTRESAREAALSSIS